MQHKIRNKQPNLPMLLLSLIILGLGLLLMNGGPAATTGASVSTQMTELSQNTTDTATNQTSHATTSFVSVPSSPEDLIHNDIFAKNALEHIFYGQINAQGNATGYHHESFQNAPGSVQKGTRTPVDNNGVYEAKVIVSGVNKSSNNGYSSFFPADWSAQQVVDAIQIAYQSRELITGNTWSGLSDNIEILMYLDKNDRIISAFPTYEN